MQIVLTYALYDTAIEIIVYSIMSLFSCDFARHQNETIEYKNRHSKVLCFFMLQVCEIAFHICHFMLIRIRRKKTSTYWISLVSLLVGYLDQTFLVTVSNSHCPCE